MNRTSIRHGKNRQAAIRLAVFLAIFTMAFPVLASYTGPQNRTETITTWSRQDCFYRATISGSAGSCSLHIYYPPGSCPAASGMGGYFNNASTACGTSWPGTCGTDISCSISLVSSTAGGCSSGQAGCTGSTSTITHPPATVGSSTACVSPGSNSWCRGGASLSLSASEPWAPYVITGIESDAAGMLCSGPSCSWAFPEGTTTLLFWALSSHGDTSLQASATMKADGTPPTLSLPVPAPDGLNGWHVSSVTVTAAASDNLSGVESVRINGGGNSFTASSDGSYNLNAIAYDLAGNSATASAAFQIDATAPTLDVFVPAPDGSGGWFLHPPSLTASAGDALSGLAGIQYSLDGGVSTSGDEVTVNADGAHSVLFQAADLAGNPSSRTSTVKLDSTPPALGLSAPALPSSGWYSSPVTVSVNTSDAASGVASAGISSDGGASWAATAVLRDGVHNLDLRAADVAGNTSSASAFVRVDSLPPIMEAAILGTEGHNGWYTSPVTMIVDASDSLSGLAGVEYRIDGGAWQSGTTVNLAVNGSHSVELHATDLAGNTAGGTHTIMLDTSLPQLSLNAAGSFHPSRETLAIGYSVSGGVSGLSEWALVVDGSLVLIAGDSPEGGTLTWDGSGLDLGNHILTLYAADEAGSDAAISQPIQLLASPSPNPGPSADPGEGSILDAYPIPIPSSLEEVKPLPTDESSLDEQPALNVSAFIDNPPSEEAPELAAEESASGTPAPASAFPDILWGAAAAATLGATAAYALGRKDEETQAAPLASSQTVDVIDDDPTDDEPPPPPVEGGPNWVYVQSPHIEYVQRTANDVWLEKSVWVPDAPGLIPGHIENTFVETTEYRFKTGWVQETYKIVREVVQKVTTLVQRVRTWLENSVLGNLVKKVESWLEPVTTWIKKTIIEPITRTVQKTWMVPVTVTKNVQVWVPPQPITIPGYPKLVRYHPTWTAEEVRYWSIAVDCKDLPHWVAIRFFEKLDPHTPLNVQRALFDRFRDGLAIRTKGNESVVYQEALDVFFYGTAAGQNAPSRWLNGEYGGMRAFSYTFNYKDERTKLPIYANAAQYLNLQAMFSDLPWTERNRLDTEHYSLCGELAAMSIPGVGISEGLHTFYRLGFGPSILRNIHEGTSPTDLAQFLDALGVDGYRGGFGTLASKPPMSAREITNIIKNDGYMLALVNMEGSTENSSTYGKLMKNDLSTNDVPHWVTVTGIMPTLNGDPIVRVYNPFNNVEEYYSWTTFEAAWNKAGAVNGFYGYVTPE